MPRGRVKPQPSPTALGFTPEFGRHIPCEWCKGKGTLTRNNKKQPCQACDGTGLRDTHKKEPDHGEG